MWAVRGGFFFTGEYFVFVYCMTQLRREIRRLVLYRFCPFCNLSFLLYLPVCKALVISKKFSKWISCFRSFFLEHVFSLTCFKSQSIGILYERTSHRNRWFIKYDFTISLISALVRGICCKKLVNETFKS